MQTIPFQPSNLFPGACLFNVLNTTMLNTTMGVEHTGCCKSSFTVEIASHFLDSPGLVMCCTYSLCMLARNYSYVFEVGQASSP